jgi:hypothetical protein
MVNGRHSDGAALKMPRFPVEIWLWAHAEGEPGCLRPPTGAGDCQRIYGMTACHHRIDGFICRREDLPLGRVFSFDVMRSVPNSPLHGPIVRQRSSDAPAKLVNTLNIQQLVCQVRDFSLPSLFTMEGDVGVGLLFLEARIPPVQCRPQPLLLLDLIKGALDLGFGVLHDGDDLDVIL